MKFRRRIVAVLAATMLVSTLGVTTVLADAPNPSSINATVSGLTVTLTGTWTWDRDKCDPVNDRYVGWEVDWNDPNAPGHVVGPNKNGVSVDVGTPTDNMIDTNHDCGTDQGSTLAGNWGPISHTYTTPGNYQVCVVTYDIHVGDEGKPGGHGLVAGGPDRNKDNSLEKNSFSLSQGGVACAPTTVVVGNPTLTTVASGTVVAGGQITDTATLSGAANPTGTITFDLFGPDDDTCATSIATLPATAPVTGNGAYTSQPFNTTQHGTYRWIAHYSGDANNAALSTLCNDPNETVVVTPRGPNDCAGTWYFRSAAVGTQFHVGDTHLGGTFTFIENNSGMHVRDETQQGVPGGPIVGRFMTVRAGDRATITFANPISISEILWHDNDPDPLKPDQIGWSFITDSGTVVGPITGQRETILTLVNLTTTTITIDAGNESGGIDFCFGPAQQQNPAIDIEKYVRVDAPVVSAVCPTLGKPVSMTFQYTGQNVGPGVPFDNMAAGKVILTGSNPNGASPVTVTSTGKTITPGSVPLNGQFTISGSWGSQTLVTLTWATGTSGVSFHTSCSQPIRLGDQYGSLKLVAYTGVNGSGSLPPVIPGPGDDADTPTGPTANVGQTVLFNYIVTNPGDVALSNVVVTDDNGTPANAADDFNPTPILAGANNVGDANNDGLLDPGEEWLYRSSSTAVLGQYKNVSVVVGNVPGSGPPPTQLTDSDPAHYIASFQAGNVCATQGKPKSLTFQYTGDNNPTSHSMAAGKVVVTGTTGNASPVTIKVLEPISNQSVALNGSFTISGTFKSETTFEIFNGATKVQTVKVHTSCSQPINLGDQYGSLKLVGYVGVGPK